MNDASVGLRLLQTAARVVATAASLEEGAEALAAAVHRATGWPVGYLLASSTPGRPLAVSAWSAADPARFRVLRQVTFASAGASARPVAFQAAVSGQPAATDEVGEAASSAGLGHLLAFPLVRPESRALPPAAVVFLVEGPGPPDAGLVEVVADAVAILGALLERRRADATAATLQAVVDGAGLPYVGLDGDAIVTEWNASAAALFGWSQGEAVGRALDDLIVPDRLRAGRSGLDDLRATAGEGAPAALVLTVADRTGREFAAELTLWARPRGNEPAWAGLVRPLDAGPHVVVRPPARVAASETSEGERALRQALVAGELRVVYQPIVEIASGHVAGFEALVRWQHPVRGLLAPTEFIPLAESSGLIVPLGEYVLAEACRQAAAWHRDPPLRMSVNVSARQLATDGWVGDVAAALESTGLAPRQLVLEITETVVMDDLDAVVVRLEELRRLGVRIAIDDFGTGHSSLSYLRTLPVDVLKIDKSFIDGIASGPHDSALARAVIRLAATLRLDAVAEGVSDDRQLAQLRRLRCPYGQGYLFSPPKPPETLAELLEVGLGGGFDGLDDGVPVATGTARHGHEVVDAEQ